jgi:hypothetical protein
MAEFIDLRNPRWGVQDGFPEVGAVKDTGQSVVVGCGYRIELVIVATGARDRHAQKRLARHIYLIVDIISPGLL